MTAITTSAPRASRRSATPRARAAGGHPAAFLAARTGRPEPYDRERVGRARGTLRSGGSVVVGTRRARAVLAAIALQAVLVGLGVSLLLGATWARDGLDDLLLAGGGVVAPACGAALLGLAALAQAVAAPWLAARSTTISADGVVLRVGRHRAVVPWAATAPPYLDDLPEEDAAHQDVVLDLTAMPTFPGASGRTAKRVRRAIGLEPRERDAATLCQGARERDCSGPTLVAVLRAARDLAPDAGRAFDAAEARRLRS